MNLILKGITVHFFIGCVLKSVSLGVKCIPGKHSAAVLAEACTELFKKYGIVVPTMSYHARSSTTKVDDILDMLLPNAEDEDNGNVVKSAVKSTVKKIALVSDAGTPGISDPGALLVAKIRERFVKEIVSGEIKIEAIPGPSAFVTALSIAGVPCADFTFLGFLPHKKGRQTLFKEIAASDRTMVFYESPHRIVKTLESLNEESPEKGIVIGRELTKIFEEIVRGTPSELISFFTDNPDKVRGEFVVICYNHAL